MRSEPAWCRTRTSRAPAFICSMRRGLHWCGIVRLTGFGRREQFRQNGGMRKPPNPHYRHRFPAELISHAVWLYHVFSLSFRDVELLLAERGIKVSYESVRQWCLKFGASFANNLRRRRPRPGDKWHLDEVFIRIQGARHYLWRAVDQNGVVLDILVRHCQVNGVWPAR